MSVRDVSVIHRILLKDCRNVDIIRTSYPERISAVLRESRDRGLIVYIRQPLNKMRCLLRSPVAVTEFYTSVVQLKWSALRGTTGLNCISLFGKKE